MLKVFVLLLSLLLLTTEARLNMEGAVTVWRPVFLCRPDSHSSRSPGGFQLR